MKYREQEEKQQCHNLTYNLDTALSDDDIRKLVPALNEYDLDYEISKDNKTIHIKGIIGLRLLATYRLAIRKFLEGC